MHEIVNRHLFEKGKPQGTKKPGLRRNLVLRNPKPAEPTLRVEWALTNRFLPNTTKNTVNPLGMCWKLFRSPGSSSHEG